MDSMKEQQLEALREAYEMDARIKELQAARDRQAAEWRRMINKAMARRSALQRKIASLGIGVPQQMPMPEGDIDDDDENDDV